MSIIFSQRLIACRLLDTETVTAAQAVVGADEEALSCYLIDKGLLTPFQVRQVKAGATIFHIGQYVVVDYLGKGGNSIVFKARHGLMPHRVVAIKTLFLQDLHRSDEALDRFRREIAIVTRLEHPNVVRAYDVLQTRKHFFLVLEYIEGRDLAAVVKERGPLPVAEAVAYTGQAASGVAYAHRNHIVHRDIKPGNLLLTAGGVIKLTDLGLARFLDQEAEDSGLTRKGLCLGTLEFMAPEQAEDARLANVRSDIYSLGATLFHLLTGELPVAGSSQMHVLQRLLMKPPRSLAEARTDVPVGLANLVDRMRSRDPEQRPASAEEVITLLQPYMPGSVSEPMLVREGSFKATLVQQVLEGQVTAEEVCRRYRLPAEEFNCWRRRFLEAGRRALEAPGNSRHQKKLRELHAKIGLQAMEIEELKKQLASRLAGNARVRLVT
jgi:serine/threonine protein kinase